MRNMLFTCLVVMMAAQLTKAQTNTTSGVVVDTKGNPLRFVFVGDNQYKYAVYSDSLGSFTIPTHADSKLQVAAPGYKDTLVSADKGAGGIQITMRSAGQEAGTGTVSAQETTVSNKIDNTTIRNGGVMAPGHQKENLHGSQYLLELFAHGYIIDASGELIYSRDFLLDYNKVTGALLMTKDGVKITETNWDQTQSFTLYSNTDKRYDFEKAPAIDKSHYVQVLASGKKYKIYKLIKTKFVRADFVNTGVTTHGNDYDEFVDEGKYFVVDLATNQPQPLMLKKKSIKENFAKELDKVNKYMSSASGDIDEAYISKLGEYMNQ